MPEIFQTELYRRLKGQLDQVKMLDTHEHLQRESELPRGGAIHIGRFFAHYANCDLISAGMPPADMVKVQGPANGLLDMDRWRLIKLWYARARNTVYFEALRIALRDLYGVEDFRDDTIEPLTQAMRRQIKPGFTRQVFDKAGIDYAMTHPFGPMQIYNPDFGFDCFIVDMVDSFTALNIPLLAQESGKDILSLGDYLEVIDFYFDRDAASASAFKIGRAYDRTLSFADVGHADAQRIFNRLLAFNDRPDQRDIQALENFIVHYLCRKCGQYGLRMKFHTGFHEGNGNVITNSRASLMANLFLKYPKTNFDIYHLSYPYQQEAIVLTKNFPNVTIDFCFAWILDLAGSRATLSGLLDAVPASKILGFGGDYIFVEGSYGHAVIARREIARVLARKVEDGRFTEDQALRIGQMMLRDNAIENFDLTRRRAAFKTRAGEKTANL
jgi:hypothetical protein